MTNVTGDETKLQELILYISEKCANDPTFGATKLNKILCFSDFEFYAYHGTGITNVEYFKLPAGPAPRHLVPVRERMIEAGELVLQQIPLRSGNIQKRTVNRRPPNLDLFSGAEIAMVDRVIDSLCNVDAEETSQRSHEMVGWMVAQDNETIPYNTVYFSNPPLTTLEKYLAQELKAEKERAVRRGNDTVPDAASAA